jgi:uncharacterized protein DUF1837
MEELGLDTASMSAWFSTTNNPNTLLQVTVEPAIVATWSSALRDAIRRAYITDGKIAESVAAHGVSDLDVIASKLPDPGSVMAGDFGEILVYIYQATANHPQILIGPKKWRLKQDRLKPAPYSDVVQFYLPHWPLASIEDALLCSEVKTKSTNGSSAPITEAIADSGKDRTSRLAKTLVWLRERALTEHLGAVHIEQLERFIKAAQFPPATRRFFAVAVICSSLVAAELTATTLPPLNGISVVVLVVPNLHGTYMTVFHSVKTTSLGSTT